MFEVMTRLRPEAHSCAALSGVGEALGRYEMVSHDLVEAYGSQTALS